jgi:predicted negative regulator of RcsB-dependent stress response
MADYRTEEEQIELLKKWWRENGKVTLGSVFVALVFIVGGRIWQDRQHARIESAADIYQQMLVAAEKPEGLANAAKLAEQLRADYSGTIYSVFAALRLAKDAVADNRLSQAVELLEWALSQKPDESIVPLVRLRLAQVQYSQGEYDKAIGSLAEIKGGDTLLAAIAELRGDVLVAQGKSDEARDSYSVALKELEASNNQERRSDIEIKISSVAKKTSAIAVKAGDRS